MLTIAETSGLIAAAVVLVQYMLPAAIAVILVRSAGNVNSAVTWSVLNRYIANTVWPHLLRADAVSNRYVSTSTKVLTWTSFIGAVLLVLASVLAPLGLSESILPGAAELIEFQYVKDPSPWGEVTMPRPNFKFSRYCEYGQTINCPGQYQGIYMNWTEEDGNRILRSFETDEHSTINTTIPRNFTEMFRSATSDLGNTLSGLFDIQYRRWTIDRVDIIDRGQPYVRGKSRHIESMVQADAILLKEGLIIDLRSNPGIGFRNHTIPRGLRYGGTWSEDITWIEPVTRCADTNLSVEVRTEITMKSFASNITQHVIDRGAFTDLSYLDLESRPWIDNQTLDLFAHALKAARMHNVLIAASLGVTLPLNGSTKTVPPHPIGTGVVSSIDLMSMKTSQLRGVDGVPPVIQVYDFNDPNTNSSNSSTSRTSTFIPYYPDGMNKLIALNYSAIEHICQGQYELSETGLDRRATGLDYPAIQCGALLGAPVDRVEESLSASSYTGVQMVQKNLYVCATAYKASIKTVRFRYNGTEAALPGLEVMDIAPKIYHNNASMPLWAVESSGNRSMNFDPLWGLVSKDYETTKGFDSSRSESLWLPTSPAMQVSLAQGDGGDALAATGGLLTRLAKLYEPWLGEPDYSGDMEYALYQRWARLSQNQIAASQIPSLILTNYLAAVLVGTKTSFTSRYVDWPASMAVDDSVHGVPSAKVEVYRRIIQYDIRYAIPSFLVLALLSAALAGAIWSATTASSIVQVMQRSYNQTSPGRLATNLLLNSDDDATQSPKTWIAAHGRSRLAFGKVIVPEDEWFCKILEEDGPDSDAAAKTISEAAEAERGQLLAGTAH
ncbi:hypothetical protein B5807_11982 [Epicoccum nigrum]|uniref:Uncharacterized protein n=1 Tax=Epicoccum nigrum TaxID=105696 RepID=A0A1Y2LHH4_EPING|nr:hypothetical protein B5807_11982 [Epicoccum nigrum]